jgi:hypothetical protein
MSNVKVIGAIELDVGTVSLLHYPKLAERNNQLRIADLPDYSVRLVNADTAKEEYIYLRIVTTGNAGDYDREQVAKILGERFADLLRLEGVVKLYGNLIWDASVRPRLEGDPQDYNHYGRGDAVYGAQYHECHSMVGKLFEPQESKPGFRRWEQNQIVVDSEGASTVSFAILGGLTVRLCHPYVEEDAAYARRHGGTTAMRGSFVGPNKEAWGWSVSLGHQYHFDLSGQLEVGELKSVIESQFSKAYPWVPFEIKNFVAVVAENPHSTTTKTVELKLVS